MLQVNSPATDSRFMRRARAWAAMIAVIVLGLLGTVIAGNIAEDRRESRLDELVNARATQIANNAAAWVGDVSSVAEGLAASSDGRLPSPIELDLVWEVFGKELPGDSTATVFASVLEENLDAFYERELQEGADYQLQLVNPAPGPEGHLLTVRSQDDAIPVGVDLSAIPTAAEQLRVFEFDEAQVSNFDLRRPATPPPNQVLLVFRTRADEDPLVEETWTSVQVDLGAKLTPVFDTLGEGYGGELVTDLGASTPAVGIERILAAASSTATASSDLTGVTATIWAQDSIVDVVAPDRVRQLGLLATALAALAMGIGLFILHLLDRADRSEQDAREDALTGLPNRRWVTEQLESLRGVPVALLFCDVDRFKLVNDRDGHSTGDELLVAVAQRLEEACGTDAQLARFGGDEFIILCPSYDSPKPPFARGKEISARVIEAFDPPLSVAGRPYRTSLSVGISARGTDTDITDDELVRRADVALGECKKHGGNSLVVFDEDLRLAEEHKLALEQDLKRALDQDDLVVHYQPIVDEHGQVRSLEALVRWNHNGTLLRPADFLPVVCEMRRMPDLGSIVLEQALTDYRSLTEEFGRDLTLHINVDASQLADATFPSLVDRRLAAHRIRPDRIILELTEGEWIDAAEDITPNLNNLSRLGVGLAIDDFGTGYSSISRIFEINGVVELKLDRSVVEAACTPIGGAFLEGILHVANQIGFQLVAEGVATAEELALLKTAGVTRFQGFHIAYPTGVCTIASMLAAEAAAGTESVDTAMVNTEVADTARLETEMADTETVDKTASPA